MSEDQAGREDQNTWGPRLDWAGEQLVRVTVVVAMLGIFGPLFTQSLAGFLEIWSLELSDASTVTAAVSSAVLLVLGRDGVSRLLG